MTLNLGARPGDLRLYLTTGADFDAELIYTLAGGTDAPWPVGTDLSLVFLTDSGAELTRWTAIIGGEVATFSEDKAVTDTIPHLTPVRLVYTNGATDRVWFEGKVSRRG